MVYERKGYLLLSYTLVTVSKMQTGWNVPKIVHDACISEFSLIQYERNGIGRACGHIKAVKL